MKDERKTKKQLVDEVAKARKRIAKLEKSEARRKRAEDELRASEENFRLMVSEVKDYAIFVLDPDGRVASWNEGARRIEGYRPEEIIGQHFSRFYAKKDVEADKPDEELREAAAHGRFEDEGWRVRKDGSQFIANVVITALRDEAGELKGFSKVTRDITERKKAEGRIRRKAEQTKLLLELYLKAPQLTDEDLYDYVLEKAVSLTESNVGFFHKVSDDQKTIIFTTWNSEALKNCTANYDIHYSIEQAGNWVDCVRFKQPVVYNDFPNSPNRKGFPEGHTPVKRFIGIPVMDGEKVRFILGVGNKPLDYEVHDVAQLQLVANEIHKIVMRRQAEEKVEHRNLVLRAIRNVNQLITKEKDRGRLIKGACENLIETRGYRSAWIALLDESGKMETAAEAGVSDDFQLLTERLKSEEPVFCVRKTMEQPGVFVIEDRPSTCGDCPLAGKYHGMAGMTVRLEYEGKLYGLMSVSIPAHVVEDKEEQSLFKEVTNDIAFALHTIEMEEERKRAENEISRQAAVLYAINRVFKDALTCETEEELGRLCLAAAEKLTGSKFGFFGEVNPAGLMDDIAISNPGWDACKMAVSDARKYIKDMPIRGINRSTIREGKSRIVNEDEMATHPDRVGAPEGHPRITAFLGVPLKHEGKTIGMIGLGNKKGGYDITDQAAVENLAVAIVEALRSKRAEKEREKLLHDMEERYKELECVYGVAESIRKRETLDEVFMDVVALIPPGWHYPEITRGKVRFEDREYVSDQFEETEWKQSSDIVVRGEKRGAVEVYYLEERPVLDEGPFLEEERDLIDGIARTLAEAIKHKRAEEKVEHLNLVLRAIRNVNQLITKEKDLGRLIKGVCENLTETRGYNSAWVALLDESGKLGAAAEAGVGDDFQLLTERLKSGEPVFCVRKTMEQPGVFVIEDRPSTCDDCPLAGEYHGMAGMTVRLEYEGKLYGLMTVSLPGHIAGDKEDQSLFGEVAGDIAFALHTAEMEEERKRAEELLRESEGKQRTLLENLPQNIFYKDTNSVYISANENFARELGTTPGEIAGKTDYDFFPKELAEKYRADDMRVMESGNTEELDERYLRDEQERIVHTVKTPVTDKTGRTVGILGIFWDITDRKRAEDELRASEENFRLMVSEVKDYAFFALDPDGRVASWNEGARRIKGYRPEEIIGQHFSRFYTKKDVEAGKPDEELRETAAHGRFEDVGWRVRKDGSQFMANVIVTALRDEAGELKGFSKITMDITERNKAEEALLQSRARYQDLYKSAPVAYFSVGTDGLINAANEAAGKLTGYRLEELRGMKVGDLYAEESKAEAKKVFEQFKQGITLENEEMIYKRKDGQKIYGLLSVSPMKDASGRVVESRSVVTDITERKRAEEALVSAKSRLEYLLGSSPAIIYTCEASGDFLLKSISENVFSILGYTVEECLADPKLFEDTHVHPDDKERLKADFQDAAAKGHGASEYRLLHKNGTYRWIHDEIKLVRDADGNPYEFVGYEIDITEHKQLESQLRQAQKMEAIGQLAGGIAHDFNNQLTAIIGFGELAMQSLEADHPAREHIEQVQLAGEKSASLTRQILAFGRRQVLQPKILSLNKVLKGCEKMLRRLVGENIELAFLRGKGLRPVKVDPSQMEQVIMNLAINARDAMPRSGKLTIETANVDFDEEYASSHPGVQPGSYVMAAVSDTGYGMGEETLSHIFEPFFTTKKEGEGTGLGLATVHGIVKQSGGHVFAYSELGKGTTIKVYIPTTDEIAVSEKEEKEPAVSPKGTETILLAEDEELVRDFVKRVLENNGYRVLAAADGEDALRVLRSHQGTIQLLMTDVVMPKMNGPELAAHAADMRPDIKVIYLSGYAENAIARHGVLEPGTVFLQKPVTVKVLSRKVREVLDAARRPS